MNLLLAHTLTRSKRCVKDCIVLCNNVNLSVRERPPTSRAAACWSLQQSLAAKASITRCFVKALIVVTASSLYVSTNWKCFWRSRPEIMETSLSCSLRMYKWSHWEEMYVCLLRTRDTMRCETTCVYLRHLTRYSRHLMAYWDPLSHIFGTRSIASCPRVSPSQLIENLNVWITKKSAIDML